MGYRRKLPPGSDIFAFLKSLPTSGRASGVERLGEEEREALLAEWNEWAHTGQLAPDGDWSTWVIKAGRGFGKTLAGSNWLTGLIAANEGVALRIALVGATIDDARRVMVEGRSGLIEVAGRWIADWTPSFGRLRFTTGAEATLFSGNSPDLLRGPEHHYAWCDELAKWSRAQQSWDMLQLGLRLGSRPRAVVTTTPRPGPVLTGILAEPGTAMTGGRSRANRHLAEAWHARMEARYAGTRLGRQELDGELLPDAAGALWTVELIEKCREPRHDVSTSSTSARHERESQENPVRVERGSSAAENPSRDIPPSAAEARDGRRFTRTLIAVDPPVGDGTCGIVAVAREGAGPTAIAHVLADHSVTGRSPEGWASAVAAAAAAHGTREIVAEVNQGGKMVQAVLLTADPTLLVRMVRAQLGKSDRATPVAHWCQAGRVRFHGAMPALEAELLGMIAGGGYEGPGTSPDRADAMVWGVSEVLREVAEPRVWLA